MRGPPAGRAWIFYVALEPYVRRRLPQIMIAWSRLLGGGVRDPLVGGHLLIGAAFGVGFAALRLNRFSARSAAIGTPISRVAAELSFDVGCPAYDLCAHWEALGAAFGSLLLLLFLFLFRALFRRLWLAAGALVLLVIAVFFQQIFPTSVPARYSPSS